MKYKHVASADFETYYDDVYSLRKMTTTQYIRDERFEAQTLALQLGSWRKPKVAVGFDAIADLLDSVNWDETAFLGHHCLPGDVEVLTEGGWQRLDSAPEHTFIMQWDSATNALSWGAAKKISTHASTLLQWDTSFHRCAYTPQHRMYYSTPDVPEWRADTANVVASKSPNNIYVPIAGVFEPATAIPITAQQARLVEAIRADGSWHLYKGESKTARWKLGKERKIGRLTAMLNLMGVSYTDHVDNDNFVVITAKGDDIEYAFSLLGAEKSYGPWVLDLPLEAREAILDEAKYWDGHDTGIDSSYQWSTASRATASAFELMAHISGWSVSGTWRDNNRGLAAHKIDAMLFTATVRKRARAKLVERAKEIEHNGPVYCYSVPTGAFMIRSNGRILITGNCNFDGLIATHHFGINPCFWLDTMGMSRLVYGADVLHSLDALSKRLGRKGKEKAQALKDVKGTRLADMSKPLLKNLCMYNADDCSDTLGNFKDMVAHVPEHELRVIDLTCRMYCNPLFEIDGDLLERVIVTERDRKDKVLAECGATPDVLRSSPKFADFLRSIDVTPPTKISVKTGKETYAFSKSDVDFLELREHEDERVRFAVEARLCSKSTLLETRAMTYAKFAGHALPIYLAYCAARTHRWGGGDASNWQNLPRKDPGAQLRESICIPDGWSMITSDASQIEARVVAWEAGQQDVVDIFAAGGDVYAHSASGIYGFEVNKVDHEDERFVGKVFVLGGGFGAGAPKMRHMLKIGQFGPPLDLPLHEVQGIVAAWRQNNSNIVEWWKQNNEAARDAFLGGRTVSCGLVTYEGAYGDGFTHFPNGTYIRYPQVYWDADNRQMLYRARHTDVKLYGGILVENRTQKLARDVLVEQLIYIADAYPESHFGLTVHDELVYGIPTHMELEFAQFVNAVMSTPPDWAPDLPLAADTLIRDTRRYGKSDTGCRKVKA